MTGVAIRPARPDDLAALIAIDDDASTLGAEAGLVASFDASHPFVVAERARWQAAIDLGLLEVAAAQDGALVGFAARGLVDGAPYLDQLSVRREAACGPELRAILRGQRDVLPAPERRIAMVRACAAAGVTPRESPPFP